MCVCVWKGVCHFLSSYTDGIFPLQTQSFSNSVGFFFLSLSFFIFSSLVKESKKKMEKGQSVSYCTPVSLPHTLWVYYTPSRHLPSHWNSISDPWCFFCFCFYARLVSLIRKFLSTLEYSIFIYLFNVLKSN